MEKHPYYSRTMPHSASPEGGSKQQRLSRDWEVRGQELQSRRPGPGPAGRSWLPFSLNTPAAMLAHSVRSTGSALPKDAWPENAVAAYKERASSIQRHFTKKGTLPLDLAMTRLSLGSPRGYLFWLLHLQVTPAGCTLASTGTELYRDQGRLALP